jgi:hypothetical protein
MPASIRHGKPIVAVADDGETAIQADDRAATVWGNTDG